MGVVWICLLWWSWLGFSSINLRKSNRDFSAELRGEPAVVRDLNSWVKNFVSKPNKFQIVRQEQPDSTPKHYNRNWKGTQGGGFELEMALAYYTPGSRSRLTITFPCEKDTHIKKCITYTRVRTYFVGHWRWLWHKSSQSSHSRKCLCILYTIRHRLRSIEQMSKEQSNVKLVKYRNLQLK